MGWIVEGIICCCIDHTAWGVILIIFGVLLKCSD